MSTYSFNEHRHRYAIWTAARAVQRNFKVTTNVIHQAIESTTLRAFVEDNKKCDHATFEVFHREWASKLIDTLQSRNIQNVSYGRVAKIIAVYLKTAVILCNQATCTKSEVIHPPLDRIILQNLAKKVSSLDTLARENWTMFNVEKYWEITNLIRNHFGSFNWKLEVFWEV